MTEIDRDRVEPTDGGHEDISSLPFEEGDPPELPGDWEWRGYWASSLGKVAVHFGLESDSVGGWFGEIDNYPKNDGEGWDIHVRQVLAHPDRDNGQPSESPYTVEEFDSLSEAIESVPGHIDEHYPSELDR